MLPAGNCVVLKPSEISKSVEKILAEVLPRYLDQVSRAVGPRSRPRPGLEAGQPPGGVGGPRAAFSEVRGGGQITVPQPQLFSEGEPGQPVPEGGSMTDWGWPCSPDPTPTSPHPAP